MNTDILLQKLINKKNLSIAEAEFLVDQLTNESTEPTVIASILTALKMKGESEDEIIGFIKGMRQKMISLEKVDDAIDIVGTGGDGSNSFNISTTSAFVIAGAGVKVAKHGNRAASSKCGSADVLEELGVNISLTPEKAQLVLEKVGMVFLFAPAYHPAMKVVGPVRKALKFRTIFNFLGPFLNPAKVKKQILGVPTPNLAKLLAEVGKKLNYEHLIIISSHDGMDEISIADKSTIYEIKKGQVKKIIFDPAKYGFAKSDLNDLKGGDALENAQIIRAILSGEKGAKRDAVILNSAVGLLVSGKVKNIKQGITLAEQSIDTDAAKQVLENLIKESNL